LFPQWQLNLGYNTINLSENEAGDIGINFSMQGSLLVLALFSQQNKVRQHSLKKHWHSWLNKCADFGSKLCRWNGANSEIEQTFYNQALNTLFNWGNAVFLCLHNVLVMDNINSTIKAKGAVTQMMHA
jgi:putative DNA methylase